MAMLFGRRRIGKTYLLQKFFTDPDVSTSSPKRCCYFLADQSTPEIQRLALADRLLEAFPTIAYSRTDLAVSWNALLRFASTSARTLATDGSRLGLVLDEFPYLVTHSPELPSVIQAWWDTDAVHAPIFVVICGSQLSAMAALGRETAPLYGRFNSGVLKMEPMRYDDVALFYSGSNRYGLKEKLCMYGILGGTPRYHAMLDREQTWSQAIANLLLGPGASLENEIRFLLSSEQIRDAYSYNAVLGAIAEGRTRHSEIQQATGLDSNALTHPIRVLTDLGWIWREFPFDERSERRSLYRIADPFLHFWYRFVAPLGSALQFGEPLHVFQTRIEPRLSDYMGWCVFEGICKQWLQRLAFSELGLEIERMSRYWSRDGRIEIDIVAELRDGSMLFGECKWSGSQPVGLEVYAALQAKVHSLPSEKWRIKPKFILFSIGGFDEALKALAGSNRDLFLVDGTQILP